MNCLIILQIVLSVAEPFFFDNTPAVLPENPFVFIGENLTLTCQESVTETNGNSFGNLYFKHGDKRLSTSYMTMVMRGKVELRYPIESGEQDGTYTCYLNHTVLGQQRVTVEYRPEAVTRSQVRVQVEDWRSMLVSWQIGNHWVHPQQVSSHLTWFIQHSNHSSCPHPLNGSTSCGWREHDGRDSFKNVPYWIRITIVVFNKSMNQVYKSESIWFNIDTKLHVKPKAVINIGEINVTSTSVCVSWDVSEQSRMRQILHRIVITETAIATQRANQQIEGKTQKRSKCVAGLSPYTEYRVSVSSIPLVDGAVQGYYSDTVSLVSTTQQDVPSGAPVSTEGAFHFGSCADSSFCQLTVYWKAVPEDERNGQIIWYNINVTDNVTSQKRIYNVTGSETSYDIHVTSLRGYILTISASTEAGPSSERMELFIPDLRNKPAYPDVLLVESDGMSLYVNWTPARDALLLTGFTLFYCNASFTAHRCLARVEANWLDFPANQTSYVLHVGNPDKLLIGLSVQERAATGYVSSGIIWSTCTFNRNKTPGRVANVAFSSNQPDKALKVEWDKPGCEIGEPYILYYILQYCRGDHSSCSGVLFNETISNSARSHTLKDLDIGTSYRATLRAVSRVGPGPESDPISAVVVDRGLTPGGLVATAVAAGVVLVILLVSSVVCVRRMHHGLRTFKLPIVIPKVEAKVKAAPSSDYKNYQKLSKRC